MNVFKCLGRWIQDSHSAHPTLNRMGHHGVQSGEIPAYLTAFCVNRVLPQQKIGTPWQVGTLPPWETDAAWQPENRGNLEPSGIARPSTP
jgi:hypothetical protein